MTPVNLAEKFSRFHDFWHPRVVGALNGRRVNTGVFGTAAFPSVYRTDAHPFQGKELYFELAELMCLDALERDRHGLLPVPLAEWQGMIFVIARPGTEPIDVEPLEPRASDTWRIAYGNSSRAGRTGRIVINLQFCHPCIGRHPIVKG